MPNTNPTPLGVPTTAISAATRRLRQLAEIDGDFVLAGRAEAELTALKEHHLTQISAENEADARRIGALLTDGEFYIAQHGTLGGWSVLYTDAARRSQPEDG